MWPARSCWCSAIRPAWKNPDVPFDGANKDEHAALEKKQGLAESNKAVAVLLVNDLRRRPATS